ncbi:MAG TPA: thiamine biosynthesis protein ThiS [Gammaproteobacteria bacterium]|nr:sulfur carrier protein ThiS [Pseudomonadota bacterium]HCK92492.1 thiamine biosynthesis protein ThiS [Gammaproteobacteria bacterium]|tara:strand:+ start:385 stop:585 length:201 start_codon:yes stop_codon:yes gene_type:complete
MIVYVNGEQENWESALTVAQWLETKQMLGKRIAVEINGSIVPKSRFEEYEIKENDVLEVIAAVGGG